MATPNASGIVSWALEQVGKPYIWGGTGPAGFDCSGLTSQSYKNGAGVTIPRVALAQQQAGTPISAADLQPADLVFAGVPAYHVAMYIGSGSVVAADHTGVPVRTRPFNATEWTGGFRRMAHLLETGGSSLLNGALNATGLSGVGLAYEGVNAVAQHLLSATWWKRIGEMAIALTVIAIGLVILNRKAIERTAGTAVKVAEVVPK